MMNELEQAIGKMDFEFFGTNQHLMDVEQFLQKEDAILLDVRAKEEVDNLKLNMAHYYPVLEIPTNEVPGRIEEIPKGRPIGVFCSSSIRSVIIFTYLLSMGYDKVRILPGGYTGLTDALKPGKLYKKLHA